MATGCQRSVVTDPLPLGGGDDAAIAYWHAMADRPVISNDEAFHGLILLANGSDPHHDYASRLAWLKDAALLDGDFDAPGDEAVERGTVASILAGALHIKGGVTMRLLGTHPRYATRELEYLNIMPRSTPQQALPGIEFMGIIARAEAYLEGRS